MKIIHIIWGLNIGGSESMLVDIINEQSKTDNIHLIIINNLTNQSLIDKIDSSICVHRIDRKPGSRNFLPLLWINFKLFTINPDIVHCHRYDIINFLLIKRFVKAKFCLTVHDTRLSILNLNKYNLCFAISKSVKNDINKRCATNPIIVYNGINSQFYQTKQSYKLTPFKIVQVGRLDHEKKGQHILLHALNDIINKRNFKDIFVDFIGGGPSHTYLKDLASELNIESHCNFLGFKKREFVYANLSKYNLLVQPSLYEGFGLTVAEGIAAKIPVLISNIEGPMEIINYGKFGYFFKSKNSKDCADKILKILMSYDGHDVQNKIRNGHEYITRMFDIKKTAKEYNRYYKSIDK